MAAIDKKAAAANQPPDKLKLNSLQVQRLAQLTNIEVKELENRTFAELGDSLKWRIDPELLLFRRICGQVVKTDPLTGVDLPVPFATVHVMDTDCDFLGYFPPHLPWVWCFPLFCRQEEITSVRTDECGRFCVWVPRFDIDWVIRWRLVRHCFPEIFVKPNLGEILQHLGALSAQPGLPPHDPGDPPFAILKDGGMTLERIASAVGRPAALKLAAAAKASVFGSRTPGVQQLLSATPSIPIPPPFSEKLQETALRQQKSPKDFSVGPARLADRPQTLDLNHYIGPFPRWRCVWELKEELIPILEVPDITFWVTQDVDGDGDQETIYSDGYFHIGWHTGPLSDITLHAAGFARAGTSCQQPVVGECGQPAILFAGLMPTSNDYIDMATGFGIRPNPPHADAEIRASVFPLNPGADTPATAPFTGTLQLYGCNELPKGSYYRLLYSYNGAAPVPFTNRSWWLDPFPGPGAPLHVTPDAQGWYPILPNPDAWFPSRELLDWPTTQYPDGLYRVTMEIGDAARNVIFTTPTAIPFLVDNSVQPGCHFTSLAWRVHGTTTWNFFPDLTCPVVHRPVQGNGTAVDIEFRVEYVIAMPHLLKSAISGSGCGGGTPLTLAAPGWSDPPTPAFIGAVSQDPYEHWHINQFDNTISRAAIFSLSGSALPGAYGFNLAGYGRAFNPAGGDPSDPQAHDWYVDAVWLNVTTAFLPVAVVNL